MNNPAPAALAALDSATAAWPNRKRGKGSSDGIMGDQAHLDRCTKEGKCEGHVLGNAVDITHDPANGADGELIAAVAIQDPRTAYVIWNRRIWSIKTGAWNPYTGANPHTAHAHISIKPESREDASPWAFGSGAVGTSQSPDAPAPSRLLAGGLGALVGALVGIFKKR